MLARIRLVFAVGAVAYGVWLVSSGIIWLATGQEPSSLTPLTLIGSGLWLGLVGLDVAYRAERDTR